MQNNKSFIYSLVILSLLFCPLFGETPMKKKQIWILIHGTFAQQASRIIPKLRWWKAQDPFHKELTTYAHNATIHSFDWCGSNSHEKRVEAGKKLAHFITTVASENDIIHLVGHSHGANVGALGAQELKKLNPHMQIATLFALAVPVSSAYYPQKANVKKVFSLFSYADFVQPVIGLFERVYPEEDHIYNLQVKINGICPNHNTIHHVIVARHLPKLANLLPNNKPHIVRFFSDKDPEVTEDLTREKDLEFDKYFTNQLITTFAESKKHGCKTLSEMSEYTKTRLLRLWNRGNFDFKSMFESEKS